jgi:hypothetical protein
MTYGDIITPILSEANALFWCIEVQQGAINTSWLFDNDHNEMLWEDSIYHYPAFDISSVRILKRFTIERFYKCIQQDEDSVYFGFAPNACKSVDDILHEVEQEDWKDIFFKLLELPDSILLLFDPGKWDIYTNTFAYIDKIRGSHQESPGG